MDDLQSIVQEMIDEDRPEAVETINLSNPSLIYRYSPEMMVQLMVDNPGWSHAQLAHAFGRQPSWTAAVLASDAFQQVLDTRRHEVADPLLSATLEERFRGLAIRAVTVLQDKLNTSGVSDLVVLKAAEIGIKAVIPKQQEQAALPSPQNSSQSVAEKLLAAMDARDKEKDRQRTVDVEMVEVKEDD